MSTVPADVAAWMLAELHTSKVLHQDDAAATIHSKFGESFTYDNDNGNLAIAKSVLVIFGTLTKDDVIWSRSGRFWRLRESGDEPGRMQP